MNRKIEIALVIGNIVAGFVIPAVYLITRESDTVLKSLAAPVAILFIVWIIAIAWIGIARWISRQKADQ